MRLEWYSHSWNGAAVLLVLKLLLVSADDNSKTFQPDYTLDTAQTIRRHGYPVEAHTVLTEDGYLLTLHRIPPRRPPPSPSPPPRHAPVLLHHGLQGNSHNWVLAGPGKALAYLLADAGYDVWMANARGNVYSKAHVKLPTTSSSPFWQYSFHEVGVLDLPAALAHAAGASGAAGGRVHYVGHSMGTSALLALAAARPEAAWRVGGAFLFAPVAFLRHARSPLRLLAPLATDLQALFRLLGEGELSNESSLIRTLARYACVRMDVDRELCENAIFAICGFDPEQFVPELLPLLLSHPGGGASVQAVVHYAQLINSGLFQQYSYGKKENIERYNSTVPPEYDLSKVNVSMHLFYAENDWLSAVMDVENLYSQLKSEKTKYLVPFPTFNHLDYIWARDVKELLYDVVLKQLEEEDNKLINENN